MNSLKGFGVLAVLGGLIDAMSRVGGFDRLVLVFTVAVVTGSVLLWAASAPPGPSGPPRRPRAGPWRLAPGGPGLNLGPGRLPALGQFCGAAHASGAKCCASSSHGVSSSPKSGAWNGWVTGGGDDTAAVLCCWDAPSGAENSEESSMRGTSVR
ncbi:hypothetical protein [Streptomyces sp. NPDC056600]|uniref:hypothetical protein n=1 Tax=Streptomyces sp. NPDC056600 TaxID=3345874 RepID=UPI00369F73A0